MSLFLNWKHKKMIVSLLWGRNWRKYRTMQGFYLNEKTSDQIRNPPKIIIVTGSRQLSLCAVNTFLLKKRLGNPKHTVTFPREAKLSKGVFNYTSKPTHQIMNSGITYFSCNVGFLLNFVIFTLDLYPQDDCHMLLAIQMFSLKHFNKTILQV